MRLLMEPVPSVYMADKTAYNGVNGRDEREEWARREIGDACIYAVMRHA